MKGQILYDYQYCVGEKLNSVGKLVCICAKSSIQRQKLTERERGKSSASTFDIRIIKRMIGIIIFRLAVNCDGVKACVCVTDKTKIVLFTKCTNTRGQAPPPHVQRHTHKHTHTQKVQSWQGRLIYA